jgi:hypothetical protein
MSIRNMAKSSKDLRKQAEEKAAKKGNKGKDLRFLNYYDMEEGEKLAIRFLPDPETGEYWTEYATHGPNLKLRGLDAIACAYTSSGEDCPACSYSFDFHNDGDKQQAGRWRRKETYIGQVLVTDKNPAIEVNESEDGNPVKLIYIPWAVIDNIQEAIMEGRIGEVIDHDFILKKTANKGGQAAYDKSYFKETEDILDDDVLELFEDDESGVYLYKLSEELPAPSTTEEVEEWLEKAIELDAKTSRRRKGTTDSSRRGSRKENDEDEEESSSSNRASRDSDDDESKETRKVGKSALMDRLRKKQAEA